MKFVCEICGYVYDEMKENVLFEQLPDTWTCTRCGALKSHFRPQENHFEQKKPKKDVVIDHDMKELSIGQLSALCSNLARGCEKQYRPVESKLFKELADYFSSITPDEEKGFDELVLLVTKDLEEGYANIRTVAGEHRDRGALRVCVWGEKVTKILSSLLERYGNEKESFLHGTKVWVCSVCGFIYVGDEAPEICPVCKVPPWKFTEIEGRAHV